MIRYWTYRLVDSKIKPYLCEDVQRINYISKCKKFVVFTKDDVDIHCINPVTAYKHATLESDIDRVFEGTDSRYDNKFRYEEYIGKQFVDSIAVPEDARYITFSDTHGDICLLTIGILLHRKSKALTILTGDAVNARENLWNGRRTSKTESNDRNEYTLRLLKQHPGIIQLTGNHDKDIDATMIIASNDTRQIVFHHAIITDTDLEAYKTTYYKGDKLTFYRRIGSAKFFHSYEEDFEPEDTRMINIRYSNMIKATGMKNYNPYIICGHDNGYIAVAVTTGKKFPPKKHYIPNITIGEINKTTKNIFHRIISTDGYLPSFLR